MCCVGSCLRRTDNLLCCVGSCLRRTDNLFSCVCSGQLWTDHLLCVMEIAVCVGLIIFCVLCR